MELVHNILAGIVFLTVYGLSLWLENRVELERKRLKDLQFKEKRRTRGECTCCGYTVIDAFETRKQCPECGTMDPLTVVEKMEVIK